MVDTCFETGNLNRITGWIENLPLASNRPVVGLLATLGIFAVAWMLRVLTDSSLPSGFPYVTFFPAVIVTSFLFGWRLGSLSAILCGLVAWYFFIMPTNSFALEGARVALAFYVFVVVTDLALVYGIQTANRRLVLEREVSRELASVKDLIVGELQQKTKEREQSADDLRESEIITQLATQTAGIGLWQWNVASGYIRWDKTMFDLYGIPATPNGSVHYDDYLTSVHPDDSLTQDTLLQNNVGRSGAGAREFRIKRRNDGKIRYIRAVEIARAGADGKIEWVVGTNLDITEQKSRESHVQFLMGEINHRAKNLLGVVLAVAHQTRADDHKEFIRKFSARVQSLAAGQDLLVENEWKAVSLDTLVRAQLSHFKDLIGERILIDGENVQLSPSAVQTIGLAVHELTTNASKYGALSNNHGRITIAWEQIRGDSSDRFIVKWTESGGPAVVAPTQSGFGSSVTGAMVRMSLDGEVTSDFKHSGFSWRLDCPLDNIAGDKP